MKTNLNCNSPKPQFGMAIHYSNNSVQRVIKSRIKSLKDFDKLNDILKKQKENLKVDISLFANPKTGKLSADVYTTNYTVNNFYKSYSENFFNRLFNSSPVKFIEKMANIADKQESKIKNEEIINKIIF